MTRHHEAEHPATVGIAIEAPVLRRVVQKTLSKRYKVIFFDAGDVAEGTWPHLPCAAIVATPDSFHAYRRQNDRAGCSGASPIVLIVGEEDLSRERTALAASDGFVLADRIDTLLPSAIVLSSCRLSVIPRAVAGGRLRIDRRLLLLPRLAERERAVLAELATGSDNATIAERLAISESMTKVCVRRLVDCFGFRNRTDTAVFAASFDLGDTTDTATTFDEAATK